MDALIDSEASSPVRLEALNALNQMMLITAHGQELDIQKLFDEASYWRVVDHKSAPFYGCALRLGALLAEAGDDVTRSLERLGRLYGEMIQIHDDLNDTMAVPANPDWLQKRKPLQILFALTVEHPDRTKFLDLYQNITNVKALQEAQEILIRCGAVSYCVDQLLRRYQTTQEILGKTPLSHKEVVDVLIEGVIAPVRKLFETLSVSPGVLSTTSELSNPE